jgi:hypothetical protein
MSFTINKTASVTNLSKRLKEAPNVITQQVQKLRYKIVKTIKDQ